MWLLQGHPAPSHMVFHRFFKRLTVDVLRDLLSQFINILSQIDSLDFSEVFIDGTKWEAYANKYTFVWKKTILKNYAKLPDKLLSIQSEVQQLLSIDVSDMTEDEILVLLEQSILEKKLSLYAVAVSENIHYKEPLNLVWHYVTNEKNMMEN